VKTNIDSYLFKIFAAYRNHQDIERYLRVILEVLDAGIHHPKLFQSDDGYVYEKSFEGKPISLIVMEYIPSQNLLDSGESLQESDIVFLAQQAALINKLPVSVEDYYDPWSITHVVNECNKTKHLLSQDHLRLVSPVIEEVQQKLHFSELPQAFVHGDLTKTNILKFQNNLFIIDFSVANIYPRIQELAVLLANTIVDLSQPHLLASRYRLTLDAYQQINPLNNQELELLPLYLQAAFLTNILGIVNAIHDGVNKSKENDYWMNLGERGLQIDWESVLSDSRKK
jgi:Ser/Thr protein kinase RdoA (MazF antagonist)